MPDPVDTTVEKTVIEVFDNEADFRKSFNQQDNQGDPAKKDVTANKDTNTDSPPAEFKEAEYLTRTFGEGFDSVDKVKSALSASGNQVKLDPEVQAQIDFIKSNPEAWNLAQIAANSPDRLDAYTRATKLNIGEMSAADKVIAKMVLDEGMDEAKARAYVMAEYGLDEDSDLSDTEKVKAEVSLHRLGREADAWLRDFQKKATLPEPQRKLAEAEAANEQKVAALRASWKPEIAGMAQAFNLTNKQEIDYHGEKIPVDFSYALSEDDRKAYAALLEGMVQNGVYELNDANKQKLHSAAQSVFLTQNFEKIASALANSVMQSYHTKVGHKFYNLPPKPGGGGGGGADTQTQTKAKPVVRELPQSDF